MMLLLMILGLLTQEFVILLETRESNGINYVVNKLEIYLTFFIPTIPNLSMAGGFGIKQNGSNKQQNRETTDS